MSWLGVIACGVASAGCNWAFGLGDTKGPQSDARPDAPGCSGEMFVGPDPVPGLEGGLASPTSPSWLDGGLAIWFTLSETGGHLDVYFADRTTTAAMFGAPIMAANLDVVAVDDAAPKITADGLDMIFLSARFSGARAWETTRASTADAFPLPHQVTELGAFDLSNGLELSSDGLTFYYVDGTTFSLYRVQRPDRASPFDVTAPELVADNVQYPAVSPDQLELFFDPPRLDTVARRTRASVTAKWDQPDELIQAAPARTPGVSPDARTLVFAAGSGLAVKTRPCP